MKSGVIDAKNTGKGCGENCFRNDEGRVKGGMGSRGAAHMKMITGSTILLGTAKWGSKKTARAGLTPGHGQELLYQES